MEDPIDRDTLAESNDPLVLRRQVEALLAALRASEEELRRRDQFLAVVAHELRNPITPVAFTADVLLREATRGELGQEGLVRRLKRLQAQVDRLKDDLTRLLDFSRIRSGLLELRIEEVDAVEVVVTTVEEMRPQLEAARCPLRLVMPRCESGQWDRLRLRQVVWNLLSNAVKFGAGAPVEVSLRGEATHVILSVVDAGPGIPEHDHERVFRQFERVGTCHTGFGVGLWLVKQIVEALGGAIRLQSRIGAGTTFTVVLPRSSDVQS